MKRHLQCAEQQVSRSNLTKCCACHAERLTCLILITYQTSFTMRGANRCHPPTSPNAAPATKNDTAKFQRKCPKTGETSFPMRGRSENDPRMIRPWSEHEKRKPQPASQPRLLFELTTSIFYCKIQTFRAQSYIQTFTTYTAPATKSDTWTSPSTAPATKSDTWTSPSIAPATKSDTWTSPNIAPATKNDSTAVSSSHMKRHFQCAEQQVSLSNLPKYCTCHEKWHCKMSKKISKNRWNVISNAGPIRPWSDHDPRMIREWSEHENANRNPPRNRGYFSSSPRAFSIEKYNVSRPILHSNLHHILRLPRKVTLERHQVLRLPRKVTLELHQVLRLPREVTLELHQILHLPRKMTRLLYRPHIWNVISNARSNRCHYPTSPNTAPATKNDTARCQRKSPKTGETSFPMRGRSDHDPRMIREWSENDPSMKTQTATRLATEVTFRAHHEHFLLKNTTFRAQSYIQTFTTYTAPATKSDTWTSPSTAPATKSDTWTSPSTAPATKSDTWTSPNTAPATKNDTRLLYRPHIWKRHFQCAEQQVSLLLYSTWPTLLDSTLLDSTLLDSTLLDTILLDSTLRDTILLDSTLLDSTVLDTILLDSTLLDSTLLDLLYLTLFYLTLLYLTLLYLILLYLTSSTWFYSTWPTLLDSTLRDTILLDSTLLDSTLLDTILLDSTLRDTILLDSTLLDSTVLDTILLDSTLLDSTLLDLLYLTLFYLTLLYLTLLYLILLYLTYSTWFYSTWPTLLDSILLDSTLLDSTLLDSTLLDLLYLILLYLTYSTWLYSTWHYSTWLYSTWLYSTWLYSTWLYFTWLYSTWLNFTEMSFVYRKFLS